MNVPKLVSVLISCAERMGYRVEHISDAQTGSVYITFGFLATEETDEYCWDWTVWPNPIIRISDHGDAYGNCHLSIDPDNHTLRHAIRYLRDREMDNQEGGADKLKLPLSALRKRLNRITPN